MGVEILKLVLGLAAVLLLMWFAYTKASKLPGFGSGHLNVVERHQMTKGSALIVVRDGDERVIFGASDHGVSEISRSTWSEPVKAKTAVGSTALTAGTKFREVLAGAVGKKPSAFK